MNSKVNYWLILEKSQETRISKGIDSYPDETGKSYSYDSLVPNHKNLKINDYVVIRKEKKIVGVGNISNITVKDSIKTHRRCGICQSTDIRERSSRIPKWKCGKCRTEFEFPVETKTDVKAYLASIINYNALVEPPTVQTVKSCAKDTEGAKSQLSILLLDPAKIKQILLFSISDNTPEINYYDSIEIQDRFEIDVKKSKLDTSESRRKRLGNSKKIPATIYSISKSYIRNPDVVVEVLIRANGFCEHCKAKAPFNRRSDSSPYLEVHHKIQLAMGGEDTIENAIALCPNCHRKMHYG